MKFIVFIVFLGGDVVSSWFGFSIFQIFSFLQYVRLSTCLTHEFHHLGHIVNLKKKNENQEDFIEIKNVQITLKFQLNLLIYNYYILEHLRGRAQNKIPVSLFQKDQIVKQ